MVFFITTKTYLISSILYKNYLNNGLLTHFTNTPFKWIYKYFYLPWSSSAISFCHGPYLPFLSPAMALICHRHVTRVSLFFNYAFKLIKMLSHAYFEIFIHCVHSWWFCCFRDISTAIHKKKKIIRFKMLFQLPS